MSKQEQIELIRQKCIEANPERNWNTPRALRRVTIRLVDVLLAIPTRGLEIRKRSGELELRYRIRRYFRWNLRRDNLTEQSDDCINFLADLLQGHEEKN